MGKEQILITGGSGLLGTRLSEILIDKGYKVSHLSRNENVEGSIRKYKWNPSLNFFDKNALNADHIIHLAGAGIADERWTEKRKKEILNSRLESSKLLFEMLKNNPNKVKSVVSASAIGYYGFNKKEIAFEENDKAGNDFLANVTQQWEKESNHIAKLNIRLVKLRIGVVLSSQGGALPQMASPIKFFMGAPLGSGNQMISWIDIDDLCNLFVYAIENTQMNGAYNAVAPQPVSNEILTKTIARILNRPVWPINVPNFLLKMALGEMALIAIESCHVKNKRIEDETDFKYQFPNLEDSLNHQLIK